VGHWFESLEEAREKIETWRIDYDDSRPHQGLKDMTPTEFALKSRSNELEIVPQQAFVILDKDPLRDIRNIRSVYMTVKNGVSYKRSLYQPTAIQPNHP
jgi:hypothetical protein